MALTHLSDERLSAWLDGELSAEAAAEVQAWLQAHPVDAARAQAWVDDRQQLREHLSPALQEPVPAWLRAVVWQRAGRPRWAQAAVVAGLLLAGALAGGGVVWQWQQRAVADEIAQLRQQGAAGTAQGWVQRAALAHAVYTPEPRHAVEVRAQEEHLARWLTRRIEVPVKLFDLSAQGFTLVGGRLLPDGPGKSAQLMYEDVQQRRVTVYLRKPEAGAPTAFRYERQGELGLFYWVEQGAGYALVGALPRETLLVLAQAIYQQHPIASATAASTPAPAR